MNRFVLAAFALLLVTNLVVLGGVAYNRSGTPVSTVELTERELSLQRRYNYGNENSGTALTLSWHTLNPDPENEYLFFSHLTPQWLDDKKLMTLGFDPQVIKQGKDRYGYGSNDHVEEAILVLEYQGDTYREAILAAERQLSRLRDQVAASPSDKSLAHRLKRFAGEVHKLKTVYSRLYVVDAGKDRQVLLELYPQSGKYLFIKGQIGLYRSDEKLAGYIRSVLTNRIHVPLPYSEVFANLKGESIRYATADREMSPRYAVEMHTGQRLEPWIASVSTITNQE